MNKRYRIAAISVLTLIAGAFALYQADEQLPTGIDAPNFKLTTLDGKEVELSKLRGKPVLLDFWATWCPPCRASLPHTQRMSKKYAEQAHIFAVNLREDAEKVRTYMERNKYDFTVLMDSDGAVAQAYRVRGIPTFVVIDAQGKVQFVQVGYGPGVERKLESELQKAIEAAKPSDAS